MKKALVSTASDAVVEHSQDEAILVERNIAQELHPVELSDLLRGRLGARSVG